jgi:L-methionine (R)-S-oxide reductase
LAAAKVPPSRSSWFDPQLKNLLALDGSAGIDQSKNWGHKCPYSISTPFTRTRRARMRADYPLLAKTIAALTEGEDDIVALMATVACELHHSDSRFDWTGFYRVVAPELLKIGPYQGGHGCLQIPFSRGVCGAAARSGEVQLVADVEAFPGHIACASSTRSELVLPVWNKAGEVIAVLDIDSDQPDAFTREDATQLTAILAQVFAT